MKIQEQMSPRFTLKERMTSGLFTGLIAAISVSTFFSTSSLSLYALPLLTGYISGVTLIPWLLNPNKFQVLRPIIAGCLVTFLTTALAGAYFSQNFSKVFGTAFISEVMISILFIMLILMVISIPATLLLSYLLSKRRNSATQTIKA